MYRTLLAALTLVCAGAAEAAVIYTPPLPLTAGGGCTCRIVNIHATNTYTIAAIEQRSLSSGGIVDSLTNQTLAPGTGVSTGGFGGAGAPFYCRIDTGNAGKTKVRASITCGDSGGTLTGALTAQ
jgi:hypothetical protein